MFPTNAVQESCNSIMHHIRASSLNFKIEETPYSIFLTVRKSFSKNFSSHPSPSFLVSNACDLSEFQSELEKLKEENIELRAKNHDLEQANAVISRNFQEDALESEASKVDLENAQHKIANIDRKLSMTESSLNSLELIKLQLERKHEKTCSELKSSKSESEELKKEILKMNVAFKSLKKETQELKSEQVKILKSKDDTIEDLLSYKMQKSSEEKELKKKEKKINQKLKRLENREAKLKVEIKKVEKKKVSVDENENLESDSSIENSKLLFPALSTLNTFEVLNKSEPDDIDKVERPLDENLSNPQVNELFENFCVKSKAAADNLKETEEKVRGKIRKSIKNKVASKVNAGLLNMEDANKLEVELMEEMEETITEEMKAYEKLRNQFDEEFDEPFIESEEDLVNFCD